MDRFTKYLPDLVTDVFYGGIPIRKNEKVLKGAKPPHIIIGTPGRVLALIKNKSMTLNNL